MMDAADTMDVIPERPPADDLLLVLSDPKLFAEKLAGYRARIEAVAEGQRQLAADKEAFEAHVRDTEAAIAKDAAALDADNLDEKLAEEPLLRARLEKISAIDKQWTLYGESEQVRNKFCSPLALGLQKARRAWGMLERLTPENAHSVDDQPDEKAIEAERDGLRRELGRLHLPSALPRRSTVERRRLRRAAGV